MKNIAIIETWTESEAGWGTRPDGISIHKSKESYELYVENFWKDQPRETPNEYSRPDSRQRVATISDDLLKKLEESENGFRVWQHELKNLKEEINYVL